MQHISTYEERKSKFDLALAFVEVVVEELKKVGLEPEIVTGGGTGSYYFEHVWRVQRTSMRKLRLYGRRLR